MKRKNGFTLIELLAVIVILAIIALIATPIVLNMINSARKKAAESSAYGYIDAIEYNNGFAQSEQAGYTEINGTDLDVTSATFNNLKLKGKKPSSGTVTIVNGKVTSATGLCFNDYKVNYDGRVATVEGKCDGSSSSTPEPSTPDPVTYATYNPGDLVYFDPVSTDTCDSTHTTSETCYKWRVITVGDDNTKENITVQMDHNIVNKSAWSASINTEGGPVTALAALETATSGWNRLSGITYSYDTSLNGTNTGANYGTLSCTSGACKIGSGENFTSSLKARMITGEEIRALTMNAGAASETLADNWTLASSYNDYFYFSNSGYELGTKTSGTGSTDLAWLIENIHENANSGATANTYGDTISAYWTLSPVSDDSYSAWLVAHNGSLNTSVVGDDFNFGARPVITIPKTSLQ